MRSRGTFRFWKRAPSFTIGLTFRFADYKCAVFFVLSPIFFTFAAVMCDFLNRDVRFWKVDSADRWDSVGPKFSRMFLF